jgi:hypothetical protein
MPRRLGPSLATLLLTTFGTTSGAVAVEAQPAVEHRFPAMKATTLGGRKVTLPRDFGGRANLLLVAFKREHQALVDTWMPAAQRLAAAHEGLRYFELPTLGRTLTLIRPVIEGGMRGGIPDGGTRDRTITLYTNVDAFRTALGIPTDRTVHALLVDEAGVVRWRAEGAFTEAAGAGLADAVARLATARAPTGTPRESR